MIPAPVYCRHCGGFTGEHRFTKDGASVTGTHIDPFDCIEALSKKVIEFEEKINEQV